VERNPADKQDTITTHSLTDYPKDLQKKVTLLHHFKKYLEGDNKDAVKSQVVSFVNYTISHSLLA